MAKIVTRAAMLVGPIVIVFLIALAIYGTEGPPDSEPVNAAARLIGGIYGVYAGVLIVMWLKAARANRAR